MLIIARHPIFADRVYDNLVKTCLSGSVPRDRDAGLLIICCLCLFAVSDQSERDQNEEGNRAVAASSRILPCANQVSAHT